MRGLGLGDQARGELLAEPLAVGSLAAGPGDRPWPLGFEALTERSQLAGLAIELRSYRLFGSYESGSLALQPTKLGERDHDRTFLGLGLRLHRSYGRTRPIFGSTTVMI
jgi:hypothetical protein